MTAATTTAMVVAGVTTTATATAMMTAAWSNSEFTDLVTTARINASRLFQTEIDSEGNTNYAIDRCKLVYPIMNVFLYFTFTALTI